MQNYKDEAGYVHSVETLGALDGPGLRYIVFLQGCSLRCRFCHNPDTWRIGTGRRMTAGELADDIIRCRGYLTGGVTISGGEPLLQPAFVTALIRECRVRAGLHTAIDTAGSVPLDFCAEAVDAADMILLDIKAFDDRTAFDLTGSDTQNAWAILVRCEETKKPVWIRHVLVPGYTVFEKDASGSLFAGKEEFLAANPQLGNGAARLSGFRCVERVDLLPFHKMGEFKWEELGIACPLRDTDEPDERTVQWSREIFAGYFPTEETK